MLFSFENQHLFLFNTINSQFTFKKSPAKLLEFSCGTLALVIHSFCLFRLLWICVLRLNKVNEAIQINCVAVPKYCLTRPTHVHKLPTCLYCYCLYLVISHDCMLMYVLFEKGGEVSDTRILCALAFMLTITHDLLGLVARVT